ncbi:hypothetical protein [Succinimonas amylolytica]|uniref:hypothetical protein n=1 Tax=Succinimonas amylolytica TaxID=83769 RepID=UPI0023A7ADF8
MKVPGIPELLKKAPVPSLFLNSGASLLIRAPEAPRRPQRNPAVFEKPGHLSGFS